MWQLGNWKTCWIVSNGHWTISWKLTPLIEFELYVQVGDGVKNHEYWGRPEDMHKARPALKFTAQRPGSDVAAETAAALAAGAIAFRKSNLSYSNQYWRTPRGFTNLQEPTSGSSVTLSPGLLNCTSLVVIKTNLCGELLGFTELHAIESTSP